MECWNKQDLVNIPPFLHFVYTDVGKCNRTELELPQNPNGLTHFFLQLYMRSTLFACKLRHNTRLLYLHVIYLYLQARFPQNPTFQVAFVSKNVLKKVFCNKISHNGYFYLVASYIETLPRHMGVDLSAHLSHNPPTTTTTSIKL